MPENPSTVCKTIVDLYEQHAQAFDRDRSRSLQERTWLDRFLVYVRPGGTVQQAATKRHQLVAALPLSLRKASGFLSKHLAFLEALPRAA